MAECLTIQPVSVAYMHRLCEVCMFFGQCEFSSASSPSSFLFFFIPHHLRLGSDMLIDCENYFLTFSAYAFNSSSQLCLYGDNVWLSVGVHVQQ